MARVESGHVFLERLCRALGIKTERSVKKVVIEADVESTVKIYVQEFMGQEQGDALLDVLPEARRDFQAVTTDRPIVVDDKGKIRID